MGIAWFIQVGLVPSLPLPHTPRSGQRQSPLVHSLAPKEKRLPSCHVAGAKDSINMEHTGHLHYHLSKIEAKSQPGRQKPSPDDVT